MPRKATARRPCSLLLAMQLLKASTPSTAASTHATTAIATSNADSRLQQPLVGGLDSSSVVPIPIPSVSGFRFSEHSARTNARARLGLGAGAGVGDFVDNNDCKGGKAGLPSTPNCCCQICPAQFLVELQLLELSADVAFETFMNFHTWHRARVGLEGPTPLPAATSPILSAAGQGSQSMDKHEALLAFVDEASSVTAGVGSRWNLVPWKYNKMNMVVESGPCCPICPSSFIPGRGDAAKTSFLEQDRHEGSGIGITLERSESRPRVNGFQRQQPKSNSLWSKKRTRGTGGVPMFLQTAEESLSLTNRRAESRAGKDKGSKGGLGNFAGSNSRADRPGDGHAACCNICVAQQAMPRSYNDVITHPNVIKSSGGYTCTLFACCVVVVVVGGLEFIFGWSVSLSYCVAKLRFGTR